MKSTSNSKKTSGKRTPASGDRSAKTRIDAPHPITGSMPAEQGLTPDLAPPSLPPAAVPAGDRVSNRHSPPLEPLRDDPTERETSERELEELRALLGDAPESLRRQASQLAGLLRDKQQEIDQREATLNARLAQLDNERRSFRLQLREYTELRAEREAEYQQRQQELEIRLADLSALEMALNADPRSTAFAASDTSELAPANVLPLKPHHEPPAIDPATETFRELESQRAACRARIQQMDTLESLLKDNWSYCERLRRDLETQQRQQLADFEEHRRRQLETQRAFESSNQAASDDLRRREESLAKRQAAVEQIHRDAAKIHHETLEMRIVIEQLWQQLADRVDAAELVRSIAAGRAQLTDEYRMAHQNLSEQRREVDALTRRLTEQQSKLRRQRTEMQEWLARRNQELHKLELRLCSREQQLAGHDQTVSDLQQQLEQERHAARTRMLELSQRFLIKVRLDEGMGPRDSRSLASHAYQTEKEGPSGPSFS